MNKRLDLYKFVKLLACEVVLITIPSAFPVLNTFERWSSFIQSTALAAPDHQARKPSTVLGWLNFPEDRATQAILKALEDQDPNQRFQAAWALRELKNLENPAITNVLLRALIDEDPWVRLRIIQTLAHREELKAEQGLIKDNKVRDAFLKEVGDPDPYIRSAAIRGLRLWKREPNVGTILKQALNDQVWMVRNASLWAGPDDLESLKLATMDEYPRSRVLAITRLAKNSSLTTPGTASVLIERLRDPNRDVVIETVQGLSDLKEKQAIRPILDLLNLGWKGLVEMAIFEITNKPLEDVIKSEKWRPNPGFKLDARVNRRSENEIKSLIKLFERGSVTERVSAILRLLWVDNLSEVTVLRQAVNDSEAWVRFAVLDGLDRRAVVSLDPQARELTASVGVLLLSDSNPHVRRQAIESLIGLDPEEISEERKTVLSTALSRAMESEKDPFVREAAVRSLHLIDQGVSLQKLLNKLIGDEFYEIRKFALVRLDLLIFPEALNTVLNALNDPVTAVRLVAIKKFLTPGYADIYAADSRVIGALQRVESKDSELEVRNAASDVLTLRARSR